MGTKNTDRIEEKVLIRASRARVWQALADSGEFGRWFGVQGLGAFIPGATGPSGVVERLPTRRLNDTLRASPFRITVR